MQPSEFRVIIVGGGPVGLTAGHMLTKMGVDWVLLEKRDNVTGKGQGSSIFLQPHNQRIYDQIGLFGELQKITHPTPDDLYSVDQTGKAFAHHQAFRWQEAL
jgi:2-polyprenyl-6-methoxyphenol hydroxylase-like FAD-dependent oxidoreductase